MCLLKILGLHYSFAPWLLAISIQCSERPLESAPMACARNKAETIIRQAVLRTASKVDRFSVSSRIFAFRSSLWASMKVANPPDCSSKSGIVRRSSHSAGICFAKAVISIAPNLRQEASVSVSPDFAKPVSSSNSKEISARFCRISR